MESYASAEPHNRPQTPRALSPMVTRCLPLGNPLEGCFCVHAYIHVYIYTCIILHEEERGECSSIESPSVVVLLTLLSLSSFLFLSFQSPHFFSIVISTAPFVFFLLHLHYFSLFLSFSSFLRSTISILSVTGNFFLASSEVSKHAGRVLAGREGRINNLTDAGVEEYPIQWSRLGPLLSLSSLDSRDCIGRETNPLNYPLRALPARSTNELLLCLS